MKYDYVIVERYTIFGGSFNIEDLSDLNDYIENYVNNNGGIHYHDYFIEEI